MVFSSLLFLFVYLPVVLAVYYLAPRRYRNYWLFIANLAFYGWGEPVYILLMLLSICLNYVFGLLVAKFRETKRRARLVLVLCIVANLSMLVFFKYFDLIAATLSRLPGVSIAPLGLGLPIGISFYTFQTMSYPIDVYRGDAAPQRNFVSFGTYVALFPQLIAGPIVRYKDVAKQLDGRRESVQQFASGVERFTVGLAKKVLIANSIGVLWDKITAGQSLTVCGAWLGALAFSLQIYFDFSGYSCMAIGLGRMLGFEFLENFNYPYISKSVTEFWRRWHISLGTWFRDYVYIPLGGNRHGLRRQLFNILVVWALTGLWHGANWTFLLWGLYYALFLILEKVFLLKWLKKTPAFVCHIYALVVAVFGWVVFQTDTVGECLHFWGSMLGLGGTALYAQSDLFYLKSFGPLFVVAVIAATPLLKNLYARLPEKARRILTPCLILAALVVCTAYLVDSTYNPFLYFRF